jgi:sensor histidine kinase regulating citrate/malate metabolism
MLQLAIILLSLSTGLVVSIVHARRQIDRDAGHQSLAIARTVASIPAIRRAFGEPQPWSRPARSDSRCAPRCRCATRTER